MNGKIPVLTLTSLITILLSAFALQPVAATTGLNVDDPGNQWGPHGPYTSQLQLNYYSNEGVEYVNFDLGNLDLVDWPVAPADHTRYSTGADSADVLITPSQGEFGMFIIDINHRSSRWASWGCAAFGTHLDDTNTGCGYHLRAAIAHLFDRPAYALAPPLSGTAAGLADASPPAKTPSASTPATQASWDTLHATPLGAFNIVNDVGGVATSAASADFCAARDHVLAAVPGFVDANNDCVIDNPGVAAANPLRFMIRSETPPRRELGTRLTGAINALFGTDVVAETFANINQLFPIVFEQGTAAAPAYDDWEMYTGGWNLGGPFPDHFYGLYHSDFASDICDPLALAEPGFILDYPLVCSATVKSLIDATLQTDDPAAFTTITESIFNEFGKRVLNIPAFSLARRDLAIKDMDGLVNVRGQGYWGYLLNLRDKPGTPATHPFGGGDPSTLRWGQKQGTNRINPFRATTLWDFNVIGLVYDGLVATNPVVPLTWYCYMCSSVAKSVDGNGDTHFVFELKQNLRFHDGTRVTAADVKFTIENYRDVPADNLAGSVTQVLDVIAHTDTVVEIVFSGRSVSYIYQTGVPIIPKHLWDTKLSDGSPGSDGKADGCYAGDVGPNLCDADLLQTKMYIGSGAWTCQTNVAGPVCAPDEQLSPGDSVLFKRFDQYHRGLSALADWSFADRTDIPAMVDDVDLGEVLACVDGVCPNLAYWDRDGSGDSATELVLVQSQLYSTWVQYLFKPFLNDPANDWPASPGPPHPLQQIVAPP